MEKNKRLFLFSIVFSIFTVLNAQDFESKPSWVENFRYKGKLSSLYWNIFKGKFKRYGEYYTDDIRNVYVRRGSLHLKAIKDSICGRVCSSARIHTYNKKSFLYGKLEIRAKIPLGKGIFPAIWMLRTDHPKVYPLGEIDIMEYISCFEKKSYQANVHIVENVGRDEIRHKHAKIINADMSKYHVYTLEWYKDKLVFLLDNKIVHQINKFETKYWPFDSSYYLIMNVAYGGNWGASCGLDDNIFPCEMLVDWIKYYKLKQD